MGGEGFDWMNPAIPHRLGNLLGLFVERFHFRGRLADEYMVSRECWISGVGDDAFAILVAVARVHRVKVTRDLENLPPLLT